MTTIYTSIPRELYRKTWVLRGFVWVLENRKPLIRGG